MSTLKMLRLLVVLSFLVTTITTEILIGPRILGGEEAEIEEHGYAIVLRKKHVSLCGGSILSARFILTAGHCVYRFLLKKVPINIFSIQYGTTINTRGANATNLIYVKNVFLHPYYQPDQPKKNDIAVLELEKPIEYSSVVQPVILPPAFNATPENATATLVGWGRTFNNGHMVENLKKIDIRVYPDKECKKVFNELNNENFICAGSPDSHKSQCKGDSGGPLIIDGVQIGVVSWSKKPCGILGYPGVFTKVSTYVLWIMHIIEKDIHENV